MRIGPHRVFLIVVLVSGITLSMMLSTQANCKRWYVGGTWHAVQSNGVSTQIELRQTGDELRGTGRYASGGSGGIFGSLKVAHQGKLDGAINGNSSTFTIYWNGSSVGVYKGTIDAMGRINGMTHDKRNPQSKAAWYSSARMKCGYFGGIKINDPERSPS